MAQLDPCPHCQSEVSMPDAPVRDDRLGFDAMAHTMLLGVPCKACGVLIDYYEENGQVQDFTRA